MQSFLIFFILIMKTDGRLAVTCLTILIYPVHMLKHISLITDVYTNVFDTSQNESSHDFLSL